jgi:hypothetical protein
MKNRLRAVFLLEATAGRFLSDSTPRAQALRLLGKKRPCKLHCSRLFLFSEQSMIAPHVRAHSRTNIDNISAFAGNLHTISRVVGEFQVRFTGFH